MNNNMQNRYNEILEMMAKSRLEAAKRIQHNKHILFDALDSKGVGHVQVNFDGSGDSGGIEGINLIPNDEKKGIDSDAILTLPVEGSKVLESTSLSAEGGWQENLDEGQMTVKDVIEGITYDALKAEHEGWENNDGAYGELGFSCEDRSISMEFYERETKFYEHEF